MTNKDQIETISEGLQYIFEQEEVDVLPFMAVLLSTVDRFVRADPMLKHLFEDYCKAHSKGEGDQFINAFIMATATYGETLRVKHQS